MLSGNGHSGQPMLEVVDAHKAFGAVRALQGVSFSVAAGEILALLGDNGAGKSTVIKAISGVHRLDHGEVRIAGETVHFRSPRDARRDGVETVYQDLALFDNFGVAENFYAGREPARPAFLGPLAWIRRGQMSQTASEVLDRLRVRIPDVSSPVELMSGGQRQAIAVARAVAFASRVVILDEPTAALGLRESRSVMDLVSRLPAEGVAVVLISHNLAEVTSVADRAVVLRRGSVVGEAEATVEQHERLVSMIVGSESHAAYP